MTIGVFPPEVEFMEVIGTKVFRVFLLALTSTNKFYFSPPPPSRAKAV
jgi:hypothetical protein